MHLNWLVMPQYQLHSLQSLTALIYSSQVEHQVNRTHYFSTIRVFSRSISSAAVINDRFCFRQDVCYRGHILMGQ